MRDCHGIQGTAAWRRVRRDVRTQGLRPDIALSPKRAAKAHAICAARDSGPARLPLSWGKFREPVDEVGKALVQMRSPRPETSRGPLNVTLATHRLVQQERHGGESVWQTVDRMPDGLLRLRAEAAPGSRVRARDEIWARPISFCLSG